jgi:hypothetical protein
MPEVIATLDNVVSEHDHASLPGQDSWIAVHWFSFENVLGKLVRRSPVASTHAITGYPWFVRRHRVRWAMELALQWSHGRVSFSAFSN